MDLNQANRNITRAWVLSAIGILARVGFPFLGKIAKDLSLHLFTPWVCPGVLALFEVAVVSFLTFMVYRKSRIATLLLSVVYIFDRGFTFIWLYVFSTAFIIIWLFVTLLCGYIFFQGIRGTFAYHKLKDMRLSES